MPHQCTSCGRTFADGSKEMLSGCPDCDGNKFQFMPAEAVDGDAGGGRGSSGGGTGTRSLAAGGAAPKKRPGESSVTDKAPAGDAAPTGDASGGVAPETAGDSGREAGTRSPGSDSRGAGDRGAVNRAAATVREWVGSGGDGGTANSSPGSGDRTTDSADQTTGSSEPATDEAAEVPEDSAQASARRDVVSEDELPEDPPETARADDVPTDARAPGDAPVPADASARDDATTPGEPPATGVAEDEATVVDTPNDSNPGLAELREELNSQFESIRIVEPGQYELNLMELYEREEYIISLQEDGKYVIEVPDAWDAPER